MTKKKATKNSPVDPNMDYKNSVRKMLCGRTIAHVRWMTPKEVEHFGWYSSAPVLVLDNGVCLWPSRDEEGNDAGCIFTNDDNTTAIYAL